MSKDSEYYWDYIKHTNDLFTSRGNFFLVAESIFFATYFTMSSSNTGNLTTKLWLLFGMGVAVNIIWFLVNYKLIFYSQRYAKQQLTHEKSEHYDPNYAKNAKARRYLPSSNFLMGIVLPLLFLVSWVLLVLYK